VAWNLVVSGRIAQRSPAIDKQRGSHALLSRRELWHFYNNSQLFVDDRFT
jgi:hypothetical protein